MQTSTDRDLLRRWRCGDQPAFTALVQRHQAMVQGVARRVTGDHHAAEDVAQAVFLVVVRKAGILSGGAADLGGWLHHVARDLARDRRASDAARRRHEGLAMAESGTCTANPADSSLRMELYGQIDDALADLPDRQRQCVVLHHLEGLPVAQVAERLDVAEGSVCQWLSRGRERLRRALRRRGMAMSTTMLLACLDDGRLQAAETSGSTAGSSSAAKALAAAYMRRHALIRIARMATAAAGIAILAGGTALLTHASRQCPDLPPIVIPELPLMSNRTATLMVAAALATTPAIAPAADPATSPATDPVTGAVADGTLAPPALRLGQAAGRTPPAPTEAPPQEVRLLRGDIRTLADVPMAFKSLGCSVTVTDPALAAVPVKFPEALGNYQGTPVAILRQLVSDAASAARRPIVLRQEMPEPGWPHGIWRIEFRGIAIPFHPPTSAVGQRPAGQATTVR